VTNFKAGAARDARDWYIIAGDNSRTSAAQVVIGQVTHFAVRNTGTPPGYYLYVAKVNRNCSICNATFPIVTKALDEKGGLIQEIWGEITIKSLKGILTEENKFTKTLYDEIVNDFMTALKLIEPDKQLSYYLAKNNY
jgi:hypothetical protein